ncbi:MAG: hypothetical protein GF307_01945 [candidate division Zixibacteria bacterium]|nr:hypothetical protein [candidate division Zixibacteria bacterium]
MLKLLLIFFFAVFTFGCSTEKVSKKPSIFKANQRDESKRVLVVDIGPLNSGIFNEMVSQGRMPNIEKLIGSGYKFEMESEENGCVANAQAAAEILTGKRYFQAGVASDWWGTESSRGFISGGWEDLHGQPLWKILDSHDINSLFINIPLTHPAPQSNSVIITEKFLLCSDEAVHPDEFRVYMEQKGILAGREGLDVQIADFFAPKTEMEKTDLEALNRFLRYPLSEKNCDKLVEGNVDPGPERLERCLRLLSWELRKDRKILDILRLIDDNYDMPDFIAIRSGTMEVAQKCFMRYHYARGFNITPTEMERFGLVIERCYEYIDEWVGEVLKTVSRNRNIVLFSGYQLVPATRFAFPPEDSTLSGFTMEYRGHPISLRLNPSDMSNDINVALREKLDVILRPPDAWPLLPAGHNTPEYTFRLLPESISERKVNEAVEFLRGIIDENGYPLFEEVTITDSTAKVILIRLRDDVKPVDLFDADGIIINAGGFIYPSPQISAFPRPGARVIIKSPGISLASQNDLNSSAGINNTLLRMLGIPDFGTKEAVGDSVSKDYSEINKPRGKPCDSNIGYRLKTLGYIQ